MAGQKLFIGNLGWDVSEAELYQLFSGIGAGAIEAKVITDRETGRSRGFAFVTMKSESDANAAIDQFHETEQLGRRIIVNAAKEQERRGGGGGGGRRDDRGGDDRGGSRRDSRR